MTISKTDKGRWRARPKAGRIVIASRTFDLQREAKKWHDDQIRAFNLGHFVDPKAGRERLGSSLDRWMTARTGTVAGSTLKADKALLKMIPTALRNLPLAAVGSQQWEALFVAMLQRDMARSSVVRMRAVVSSYYGWAMRQKIIAVNPVKDAPVPNGTGIKKPDEVHPFTIDELREVVASLKSNQADIALFLGLSGLRWGEMVALRVRDIAEVPRAAVRVSKSAPDGQEERATTKGGGARTVPLTAGLVPIAKAWAAGKKPDDYLFTSAQGHKLNWPNWRRSTDWSKLNRGRRIRDPRHTAATFWLSSGIDAKTVQTWLGHASMTLTVDTYAHWMGSDADNAAIRKIDDLLGDAGGTPAKAENE